MFKLNILTVALVAALGLTAEAVRYEVKEDVNICNGGSIDYSCAGSPNLPRVPLSGIPTFDFVIGFPDTNNNQSPNCGRCFKISYTDPSGAVRARNVTVVNNSEPLTPGRPPVINLCRNAYRVLTGITGPAPRELFVDLEEQPRSICGL